MYNEGIQKIFTVAIAIINWLSVLILSKTIHYTELYINQKEMNLIMLSWS